MLTKVNRIHYYASNLAEFDKSIAWSNYTKQPGLKECELARKLLAASRARIRNIASYSNLWLANQEHTSS